MDTLTEKSIKEINRNVGFSLILVSVKRLYVMHTTTTSRRTTLSNSLVHCVTQKLDPHRSWDLGFLDPGTKDGKPPILLLHPTSKYENSRFCPFLTQEKLEKPLFCPLAPLTFETYCGDYAVYRQVTVSFAKPKLKRQIKIRSCLEWMNKPTRENVFDQYCLLQFQLPLKLKYQVQIERLAFMP